MFNQGKACESSKNVDAFVQAVNTPPPHPAASVSPPPLSVVPATLPAISPLSLPTTDRDHRERPRTPASLPAPSSRPPRPLLLPPARRTSSPQPFIQPQPPQSRVKTQNPCRRHAHATLPNIPLMWHPPLTPPPPLLHSTPPHLPPLEHHPAHCSHLNLVPSLPSPHSNNSFP